MAYATEATRLAEVNADEYNRGKKERATKAAKSESSDVRSTTDSVTKEPAKTDATNEKTDAVDSKDAKEASGDAKK
jgi:hypothetical protein